MTHFTEILQRVEHGDAKAVAELFPIVYEELRRLAAVKMVQEVASHTLQPTALVHEAWIRLCGNEQVEFRNRAHFFGAAAESMRRILIEHARRRVASKRGNGISPLDLADFDIAAPINDDHKLLAVNEVLERFAAVHPRKAELVKLRYFIGFNYEEAASTLGISVPTAKQWWAYARAWLTVELRKVM